MVKFKKIKTYPKRRRKALRFKGGGTLVFCGEMSFHLVFPFFSASTGVTYIFTTPTYKVPIISLEPCALNAEF
jgi:hypothetical protein